MPLPGSLPPKLTFILKHPLNQNVLKRQIVSGFSDRQE
jgi:hypothetical protein